MIILYCTKCGKSTQHIKMPNGLAICYICGTVAGRSGDKEKA